MYGIASITFIAKSLYACIHSYDATVFMLSANLSGLPAPSLSHENNTFVFLYHFHKLGVVLPHWQRLSLLQDLPESLGEGTAGVLVDLDLGDIRDLVLGVATKVILTASV